MTEQLIVLIGCGCAFSVGGAKILFFRREIMPMILTAFFVYHTHSPWALTALLACGITALGYGDKSPLRHCFGDSWGRGTWSLLVALSLSLWAVLTGNIVHGEFIRHLALPWFFAYLVAGFFCEPLFKNLWQIGGDLLIGMTLASVVFAIH